VTENRSILVVDDHPLLRKGIAQLLAMDVDLVMVGEARNHEEAIDRIALWQPALVLLDLNLGGRSGLDTLRVIRDRWPHIQVLILTVSDTEDDLLAALKAGAIGYALKDMEPEELLQSIHSALTGEVVLSPRLTRILAHAIQHRPSSDRSDARMTERERQIVQRVAQGKSNKIVARELGITEGTVKVHVKRLLRKLDLHSRVDIAVWAVEHGYRQGALDGQDLKGTPCVDPD